MDNLFTLDNSYLLEILLGLDGFVTILVSAQYIALRRLYSSFTTALNNGINSVNLETNENKPSYCVVRGRVKGLAPLIKSLSKPNVEGVFQDFTIKEHAVRRLFDGIWVNGKDVLDSQINAIPFEIRDDNFQITVKSPLEALHSRYLRLPLIEDHFQPSNPSIFGLILGIHQKGFQLTEYLLQEDDILTAFGEIVVGANQKLELIRPREYGLQYIFATTDPEMLAFEIKGDRDLFGFLTVICGFISLSLAAILIFKWWNNKQIDLRRKRLLDLATRARLERQKEQPRNRLSEDSFACVVCLNQPREVILLPCGHISMCYDCAYRCDGCPCPICRKAVSSIHLVYFS